MALRYVAGYQSNLLQRASSITVTNEDSLFPKANLYDGTGAIFKGSAEASGFNITADLGEVPANGGFESAFTGGLPGTGWGKTAGATLTRDTAIPRTGAGCMAADGTTSNYGYFTLTVYPGQRLKIEAACRVLTGAGPSAKVRVRNMFTGRLLDTNAAWLSVGATSILENATTSYTTQSLAFTVETGPSFPATMTLRVEFYCILSATDTPVYDDIAIYYAVNFCSVHWSNMLLSALSPPQLRSSTDNFSASDTLEASMTVAKPAFYVVLGSTVYRRYWRFRHGLDGSLLNGGNAPVFGEMVIGYAEAAARPQDYGWTLGKKFQQVRTQTQLGAEAVYLFGEHEQRRLGLNFSPTTAAEFLELRDRLYRVTRGGADPLVIVPYDSEDVVIHGRLGPELAIKRELITRWGFSMEVLETAPSVIVG